MPAEIAMLTPKQNKTYLGEWGKVRRKLRAAGYSPKAADAMRHQLHVRALGYDKPHERFINSEMDEMLKCFRALSKADDIDAQIRLIEQPIIRARYRATELVDEIFDLQGTPEEAALMDYELLDYVRGKAGEKLYKAIGNPEAIEFLGVLITGEALEDGFEVTEKLDIAFREAVHVAGYLDGTCRRMLRRSLMDCTERDLTEKILPALTYHKNRLVKRAKEAAPTDNPF